MNCAYDVQMVFVKHKGSFRSLDQLAPLFFDALQVDTQKAFVFIFN